MISMYARDGEESLQTSLTFLHLYWVVAVWMLTTIVLGLWGMTRWWREVRGG